MPDAPLRQFTLQQAWTLNATYSDPAYGVTFHYPAVWQHATQFGYHPPALTMSGPKPIAGFGYSEGGFPRDHAVGPYSSTNMEGVGIVYSAVAATTPADCEAIAAPLSERPALTPISLNGRSFSVRETASAGMSQDDSGKLYVTYAGHTCYFFETSLAVGSPDDQHGKPLTPAQLLSIAQHFGDIMKTVRIAPPQH